MKFPDILKILGLEYLPVGSFTLIPLIDKISSCIYEFIIININHTVLG